MAKFQVTEVQKALKGFDYPGSAEDLAKHAQSNGGDAELVEALRGLQKKDGFDGPNTVMKELSAQADALGGPTPGGRKERETKHIEGPSFQVTEVQKALKGADYPMSGPELAEQAKKNGGSDELVEVLQRVGQVEGPNGVMKAIKDSLGGPTDSGA